MTREQLGDHLALVNACLNFTSACLIAFGRAAIAKKLVTTHRNAMVAAFVTSALFLVSYLTRMGLTGPHQDPHHGALHFAYLAVLATHVILAIVVVPMILRTLWLARSQRFVEHRKIARFTFPVWLYVSVTGVVVYVVLYQVPA